MAGFLEVLATSVVDAERAEAGGADRVVLVRPEAGELLSPEPTLVREVRRATTIQIRVPLRLRAGFSTDGGEATRLVGLASSYRDAGVDGLTLGFLNALGGVDLAVCRALLRDVEGAWSFDYAFDRALDPDKAWAQVVGEPRLDGVVTAGSARGVDVGLDDLCSRARAEGEVRQLIIAGGGLLPEHIAWLLRAGVRSFHLGCEVREQSSLAHPLNLDLLQSWRKLIDHEAAHLASRQAASPLSQQDR